MKSFALCGTNRSLVQIISAIAVTLVLSHLLQPQVCAASRPDIVLIMADDIGYSDIGCYGGEILTPQLDALAQQGLRFTNFYSENMCWVSRAAMLTGIYHKTSLSGNGLHPRCLALPELLRGAGYQTRMSGKWHLAGKDYAVSPLDRGFEHYYGILGGAASFFAPANLRRDRDDASRDFDNDEFYLTDAISDQAVSYIDAARPDEPLFLYVAYTAAHWPLHARAADIDKYKGRYRQGWDKLRRERLARMKQMRIVDASTPLSPRHENVPSWNNEPHPAWQQRRMEVYAAQITVMDEGIGRVVDALKRTGRFENTLIMFMIDNGGCHVEYGPDRKGDYLPEQTRDGRPVRPGNLPQIMPGPEDTYQSYGYGWANASNTPYRLFKQFDHEGGIRTPLIAHWPQGISKPGGLQRTVSHLIDIWPTVAAAAEIQHPGQVQGQPAIGIDGRSLLPTFRGLPVADHESLFFMHNKGQAIRHGDWKLVKTKTGPWELYHLAVDPNELHDQSTAQPERVRQLRRMFETWLERQKQRSALGL